MADTTQEQKHLELVTKMDTMDVKFNYMAKTIDEIKEQQYRDLNEIKARLDSHYVNQDQFKATKDKVDNHDAIITKLNWAIVLAVLGVVGTAVMTFLKQ